MSDLLSLDEARQTLRAMTVIALEAHRTFTDALDQPARYPSPEQSATRERILAALVKIREGFMLALHTSDVGDDMRRLIQDIVDWTWLNELGLRGYADEPLEKLDGQVIVYQHALIALGVLPRLPITAITFPHRSFNGSYRDITPPSTPGAVLDRIEELEKTVWRMMSEPLNALPGASVRRTYGFFEATTWLVAHQLRDIVKW